MKATLLKSKLGKIRKRNAGKVAAAVVDPKVAAPAADPNDDAEYLLAWFADFKGQVCEEQVGQ